MFKVKIITVGKTKEQWLSSALEEYQKRLQGKIFLEWIFFKKDEALCKYLLKAPSYIALDPQGKLFSSEEWAKAFHLLGSEISFVIGGPEGIPSPLLQKAKDVWSLSPLTFTHQMTRLICVEQMYRALEIERKSAYHK